MLPLRIASHQPLWLVCHVVSAHAAHAPYFVGR